MVFITARADFDLYTFKTTVLIYKILCLILITMMMMNRIKFILFSWFYINKSIISFIELQNNLQKDGSQFRPPIVYNAGSCMGH